MSKTPNKSVTANFHPISLALLISSLLLVACGYDESETTANVGFEGVTKSGSTFPVTQTPVLTSNSLTASQSSFKNWLTDKKCQPPCWQGITAGISNAQQATIQLKTLPFATEIRDTTNANTLYFKHGVIEWKWSGQTTGAKNNFVTYEVNSNKNIIDRIRPQIGTYIAKELIANLGVPSHVIAVKVLHSHAIETWNQYYFVYLERGLILGKEYATREKIDENLEFDSPIFFIPGTNNLNELGLEDFALSPLLIEWKGYAPLNEYCRKFDGSKCSQDEVIPTTPRPTLKLGG